MSDPSDEVKTLAFKIIPLPHQSRVVGPNRAAELIQEFVDSRNQHIGNLLARIHRDGGQHFGKHGIQASCHAAESVVVRLHMDAIIMADCLLSMEDAGFSLGPTIRAAIDRAKK